jgi:hypothetical protein
MLRYDEFAEVIKTPEGKRRISTLYYPKPDVRETDIYILTKINNRLDLLAYDYYGDTRYWPIIAKANNLHFPTLRVPVGIRLRIPYPLAPYEIEEMFTEKQK